MAESQFPEGFRLSDELSQLGAGIAGQLRGDVTEFALSEREARRFSDHMLQLARYARWLERRPEDGMATADPIPVPPFGLPGRDRPVAEVLRPDFGRRRS